MSVFYKYPLYDGNTILELGIENTFEMCGAFVYCHMFLEFMYNLEFFLVYHQGELGFVIYNNDDLPQKDIDERYFGPLDKEIIQCIEEEVSPAKALSRLKSFGQSYLDDKLTPAELQHILQSRAEYLSYRHEVDDFVASCISLFDFKSEGLSTEFAH